MKEWYGVLAETNTYQMEYWCKPEQTLLFDIETTGLSAKTSMLYMIGYCFYQEGHWNYHMLFNDDGRSEFNILSIFFEVSSYYHTLIHYNGDGFDIPYLLEKSKQYESFGMSITYKDSFASLQSLDLYKIIKGFRTGLPLPNLKLQTLEQALHIPRTDTTNGGELIHIYQNYLRKPLEKSERLLFQHNYDDILAMIPLLQLLGFQALKEERWTLTQILQQQDKITISLQLTIPLPIPYTHNTSYLTFHGNQKEAVIHIPIYEDTLYYFLADWKNYYYLSLENKVVHKSLAAYVDTSCKRKAKKEEAYIKKEGSFLAIPSKKANKYPHIYKRTMSDSLCFIECSELNLTDIQFWLDYLHDLF